MELIESKLQFLAARSHTRVRNLAWEKLNHIIEKLLPRAIIDRACHRGWGRPGGGESNEIIIRAEFGNVR